MRITHSGVRGVLAAKVCQFKDVKVFYTFIRRIEYERYFIFLTTTAAHEGAACGQKARRRSIFASVLEALHYSRRRQAQGILRQYRHLIAQPGEGSAQDLLPISAATRMPMLEMLLQMAAPGGD